MRQIACTVPSTLHRLALRLQFLCTTRNQTLSDIASVNVYNVWESEGIQLPKSYSSSFAFHLAALGSTSFYLLLFLLFLFLSVSSPAHWRLRLSCRVVSALPKSRPHSPSHLFFFFFFSSHFTFPFPGTHTQSTATSGSPVSSLSIYIGVTTRSISPLPT